MTSILAQIATTGLAASATSSESHVGLTELHLLEWSGSGMEVRVGGLWLLLIALGVACAWWVIPWLHRKHLNSYRTKAVKLSFKGVEWEICPDTETRRVAHQAWVEIKSRKVGLPFEENYDVIVEVYNSWYQLFAVLRDLAKSIPADRLDNCCDTRTVVSLLMSALNDGLRPHLTKWQAKFRRWYEIELAKPDNAGKSPQEIQQRYPQYNELMPDLRKVSEEFVRFTASLEQISTNAKPASRSRVRPKT
ncbi:MAG: hypothetical protein ACOYOU_02860 [Kiritimatiellia bacterium]